MVENQIIEIPKEVIDKAIKRTLNANEIAKAVTKKFNKEKWVQNEYWEPDGNGDGVMCASFINCELDQLSVFIQMEE